MWLHLQPYKWLSDQWNLWNPSSNLTLSSSVFQHPQKATAVTLRGWRATAQMLWQPGGRMQGQDINSFNIVFVSVVWWQNNKPLITFRKADRWRPPLTIPDCSPLSRIVVFLFQWKKSERPWEHQAPPSNPENINHIYVLFIFNLCW